MQSDVASNCVINKEKIKNKLNKLGFNLEHLEHDVACILEYSDLLNKHNLSDLISSLMAENKKSNFLDTLAEYNFISEILKYHLFGKISLYGELEIKYEEKLGNRNPDVKIVLQEITYWIQIKRSNKLEIEERIDKLIKQIEIRSKNIMIPRYFNIKIDPHFDKRELNDLMIFIEKNSLCLYERPYNYEGKNGEKVVVRFDHMSQELTHLTLACSSPIHSGDVTGMKKTQIKNALSKTAEAFECTNENKINLIVIEMDQDSDLIDFLDAIYGTKYTEDANGFTPRRGHDGLYLTPAFSDNVVGIVMRKRKQHNMLCSNYDQFFFPNPNQISITSKIDCLMKIQDLKKIDVRLNYSR